MAVTDLVGRTDHEIVIGDIRAEAAAGLLRELGAPERIVEVDVGEPDSRRAALADADVVLNATYMRHNVGVTDAAIAARVHLVDLGSYYPETLEQLDRGPAAEQAGCRIVIGCGVAPGLTNILARLGADSLESVESVRMYSYGTHPLFTSPGIVVTRFDVAAIPSLVFEHGRLVERPSLSDEERVVFPDPYGEQTVYLVPHPEPVTLPRYLDVENVVIKLGYPPEDRRRLDVLLELGFDREEEFEVDGVAVSPRRFAAEYVGSRGIPNGFRSANVKQVCVDGARDGRPVTLVYDFAVEQVGRSASSVVTGTVAAIAAAHVAGGGPTGVHPPEAAFDARAFVDALAERGLSVTVREVQR